MIKVVGCAAFAALPSFFLILWVETQALHVDELLKQLLVDFELIPTPVELRLGHWRLAQMLEIFEVWMGDSVPHRDALIRRELEHAREQIKCEGVRMRDLIRPPDWRLSREAHQVIECRLVIDESDIVLLRHTQNLHYFVQLPQVVLAAKNSLFMHELPKYAADRPHVEAFSVMLLVKNNLRGSVPAGDHINGHFIGFGRVGSDPSKPSC